jgi:phage-related protein
MDGTDGLFEIRIEFESNIYRVFCCFDEGNIVVLFNGFQKKSQKTPKKEIDKALKIKDEYFYSKRKNDESKRK